MEEWGIWYKDGGFLIWITPSRYQSHESIYWACITHFVTSVYLISWCLIHVWVYAHDTVFNTCFWFRFIDTRVLVPARHLAFTTRWGVSDSPGSLCPDLGAWSLWILPDADQRCAAEAWIICRLSGAPSSQTPLLVSRVFFLQFVSAFCTIHYCISLYILAFAPFGDVISL